MHVKNFLEKIATTANVASWYRLFPVWCLPVALNWFIISDLKFITQR